jgi:hypothetical protein
MWAFPARIASLKATPFRTTVAVVAAPSGGRGTIAGARTASVSNPIPRWPHEVYAADGHRGA